VSHRTLGPVRLYGLVVDADVELPAGAPAPGAHPDLVVRSAGVRPVLDLVPAGRLLGEVVDRGRRYHTIVEGPGGEVTLRVHGVADFEVAADRASVHWWRDPSRTDGHVALLVAAAVPALVLALRGRPVLHASAVEVDGAALAFVGLSGMGKSTLAGLFCAAGAPLVTDDVLHVRHQAAPLVVGGCRELRLRPSAASLLELFEVPPPTRLTIDERLAVAPVTTGADRELPLHALVVPRPDRNADGVAALRVAAPEAAMQMVRFARSPLAADAAHHRQLFSAAADVAEVVPMWIVTVPWGQSFDVGVPAKICAALGLAFP